MRKSISFVLILIMALLQPVSLFAQEAKITDISKGQKAPFDGVLFNIEAAAKVMAEKKFAEEECRLKIDLELEKLKANLNLQLENKNVTIEANQKKYHSILQIKDQEIKRLTELAIDADGDYSKWWALGGFVSGILVTTGIFFITSGATK